MTRIYIFRKDTANRAKYKIKLVLFLFPRCRVSYGKILQAERNAPHFHLLHFKQYNDPYIKS